MVKSCQCVFVCNCESISQTQLCKMLSQDTLGVVVHHCHCEVDLIRAELRGGADGVDAWLQQR